jgi:hypothetical protein
MSALPAIPGIVHGKTIELAEPSGLPDGQAVTVTLKPVGTNDDLAPGEGLRRAFGAWAEDAKELDEFLLEVRRARRRARPELEPPLL